MVDAISAAESEKRMQLRPSSGGLCRRHEACGRRVPICPAQAKPNDLVDSSITMNNVSVESNNSNSSSCCCCCTAATTTISAASSTMKNCCRRNDDNIDSSYEATGLNEVAVFAATLPTTHRHSLNRRRVDVYNKVNYGDGSRTKRVFGCSGTSWFGRQRPATRRLTIKSSNEKYKGEWI